MAARRFPLLIAHRGASFDAPENTLAAFRLGLDQGADGVEGDFHVSTDRHIVCFHDSTTKRIAGVDYRVDQLTLAELRRLDIGAWKGPQFTGERVATLAEVLDLLPVGRKFFIEIKCGVEIVPLLADVLASRRDRLADLRFVCFDETVVAAVKLVLPTVKAYWLTGCKRQPDGTIGPAPTDVLATLRRLHADGVDAAHELYDFHPNLIAMLHDSGFEAHTWTVDAPNLARTLAAAGIDSITTNRPGFIRERLNAVIGH
jgi:glycerophosphoryl diester phosphodiesterase